MLEMLNGNAHEGHAEAVCHACEVLLAGIVAPAPGEAAAALRRLGRRVEALLAPAVAAAPPPPDAASVPGVPPRLEVWALGPTRLRADGRALNPPRRSRLVIQYLLAHRERPVPRDVLLEAFWPASPPAAARNSLHVAVTILRRSLEPVYGARRVVRFADEAYGLDPAIEVWLDAEEYDRLARAGAAALRAGDPAEAARLLAAARDLHRGPLFADEPYETWIVERRRERHARHLADLTLLAQALAALGERGEAAEVLGAVLRGEPEREDAHRLLMELHAAEGRGYLALRQFETCADALRRTLGVEPGPEIRATRERIATRIAPRAATRPATRKPQVIAV